jgi:hypothetical protein
MNFASLKSIISSAIVPRIEPVVPAHTVLEFTDQEVTFAVQEGRHVFEWDGTKGQLADYTVNHTAGEWQLQVIALGSSGAHGFIAATPTGRRTLNIFKIARIKAIVNMGFSEQFARIYISRSRNIRHNQIPSVIEWVGRNYLMSDEVLQQLIYSNVATTLARELCDDKVILSQTRMHSALEIVRSMRHDDRIINYIAKNLAGMQVELHDTGENHNEAIYESLSFEDEIAARYLVATYPDRRPASQKH